MVTDLRGPCDCPRCQTGDEAHCFAVLVARGIQLLAEREVETRIPSTDEG